jgi:acyl-CoA thioesterase
VTSEATRVGTDSRSGEQLAAQSARALYVADRASHALGMQLVDTGPGRARVAMAVRDDMLNGHATCHGGLIFALADSAFAFACNSHGYVAVAADAVIDFLAPARAGDELIADASEVWRSRTAALYEVAVADSNGKQIAIFRGRAHRLATQAAAGEST